MEVPVQLPVRARRRDVVLFPGGVAAAATLAPLAARTRAAAASVPTEGGRIVLDPSDLRPLQALRARVETFTLGNGMRFVVVPRRAAPVAAFHLVARVGAADEADGRTGTAHLLEHLAFKGTRELGTTDWEAEAPLLAAADAAFVAARRAAEAGDWEAHGAAMAEASRLRDGASKYCVDNAYGLAVQAQGGVGLNAQTSQDVTRYYVSLPSSKVELWFALESARFLEPVIGRQFYEEKAVVQQERRMTGAENNPMTKFTDAIKSAAFPPGHPYRRPVIGFEEDIDALSVADVTAFFDTHYGPANLTAAIVGDVDIDQVRAMAEAYWGRLPKRKSPPPAKVREPPLVNAPGMRVEVQSPLPTLPVSLLAYRRPAAGHPDCIALDVAGGLLSTGRTGRFYKNLILPQVALTADSAGAYPDDGLPTLSLFYASPATRGDEAVAPKLRRLEQSLLDQIGDLAEHAVPADELASVQLGTRASTLALLESDSSLAEALCSYEAVEGGWERLLSELEEVEALTPEAVRSVCERTFVNPIAGTLLA